MARIFCLRIKNKTPLQNNKIIKNIKINKRISALKWIEFLLFYWVHF
jgi:hypothetical protein